MKRLGIIFIGLLLSGFVEAQNQIVEYTVWLNKDLTTQMTAALTPSGSQTLQSQIDANALDDGMNVVHWRFRDQNGLYSSILSGVFYKNTEILSSNRNVVSYEYWFNDEFSNRTLQTITAPTSTYWISDLLDVDSLPQGVNTFHIRFKDELGFWSGIYSAMFNKNDETFISNRKLVRYEYWYNAEDSSIQTVPIAAQTTHQLNQGFDVNGLEEGVNVLHARYIDESGLASSVLSTMFYKNTEQVVLNNELETVAYWVDRDTGNIQITTAGGSSFIWLDNLDFQSLTEGAHYLHYRLRDQNGVWSSLNSHAFYKRGEEIINSVITDYRYWYNNDSSGVFTAAISNPAEEFHLLDNLDMRGLPSGNHEVHFQFRDSTGFWSSVLTDSVFKNPFPIASFSYTLSSNCDSTTVSFTDLSIDAETYSWDFGDGFSSSIANPTHTYTSPGQYTVELLVADTSAMLDSSTQLVIQVIGNTTSSFSTTQCESYTSPSGITLTASGVYTDTIANSVGCDSIITIDLTVLQPGFYTDVQASCGPFTWIDGNTYTSSTQLPTFTLAGGAANGCDSIVTLDLTVGSPSAGVDVISACDSYTWLDGITYTTSNNTATWTTTNAAGCDSVVTLDLSIQSSSSATDIISACDSYTWIDGVTYTSSNNTATHTLTNAAGCDSVITLNLTMGNSNTGIDVITACGSYTWIDGQTYTSSNSSSTWTLTNTSGCDSVVTLNLTVIEVDTQVIATATTLEATANNATFQWLDCNDNFAPIAGANQGLFQPINNGMYAVEIQQNGCVDTTACYPITQIGIIESTDTSPYLVFPNPTSRIVNISGNFSLGHEVRIQLLNLHGQVVGYGEVLSGERARIDVDVPDGIYFVRIGNGKSTFSYRIIIQH